jgi:hypothetical protein
MYPPIVHFDKPVAAPRETAIVRGHHQRDALGRDHVQQQLEDRNWSFHRGSRWLICQQNAGLFISARQSAVRWRSPPESFWMRWSRL